MHNGTIVLFFLMGKFSNQIPQIDTTFPSNVAIYYKTICFEYPQFRKIFQVITRKIPLLEKKSGNLLIYHSFGILPFGRTFVFINFINYFFNLILFRFITPSPLSQYKVITLTPEFAFISLLFKKRKIYFVSDNFQSLPWWKGLLPKLQLMVIDYFCTLSFDNVLVVSLWLKNKYKKLNKNTIIFYTPTKIDNFIKYESQKRKSVTQLSKLSKPIIGFIGSIYEWKVDIILLLKLMDTYNNCTFVTIGETKLNRNILKKIESHKNYFNMGYVQEKLLPNCISFFDICIIPYKMNDYGLGSYPVKIMEYLALGKPVVSVALSSIKYLYDDGLIYWSRNINEFIKYINYALKNNSSKEIIKKRSSLAFQNSWKYRISHLLNILDE